tara:strand:+ start:10968 stop:11216 length:249 start_codon:yes stop_codon:yes gene_type:complete
MAKEPKLKLRASFPAELRAKAKAENAGVISISIEFPNGDREERQMTGNALECRFARWAAVMLSEPQVKELVDLEEVVRDALE